MLIKSTDLQVAVIDDVGSGTGATVLTIAGVSGKTTRIYGLDIFCDNETEIELFNDNASLAGTMTAQTVQLDVRSMGPANALIPHFTCGAGNDFTIVIAGPNAVVGGKVLYTQT